MTELAHQQRMVRASISVKTSPMQAWEAWAKPDKLAQWFPDHAEGSADVGQTLRWRFDRFDMEMAYKVNASEPGKRLVLGADTDASSFLLEIVIEQRSDETIVHVVNSGLSEDAASDDEIAGIDSGWQMALGTLKYYVENHFGEDRQSFFAVREAEFEYDTLIQFYRDGFKLSQWLTNEGALIDGKPTVNLLLRDGRMISGTLLAETPREVSMSWNEIHGVIELKAFELGEGRRAVCVNGSGWGLSKEEARVIEGSMEAALDRLVAALAG